MRKLVTSFVLGLAIVCLSCVASVAKAEFYAMHELSVSSASENFEAETSTFRISEDNKTFSFTIGYLFNDLGLMPDVDLSAMSILFPLKVTFDKNLFTASITPTPFYSSYLISGTPIDRAYGFYVVWNDTEGSLFGEGGNLFDITFALNDGVLLDDAFDSAINFSLDETSYDLAGIYRLTAPTIMVAAIPEEVIVPEPEPEPQPEPGATTPEPATLLLMGLGLAGVGLASRRRKK